MSLLDGDPQGGGQAELSLQGMIAIWLQPPEIVQSPFGRSLTGQGHRVSPPKHRAHLEHDSLSGNTSVDQELRQQGKGQSWREWVAVNGSMRPAQKIRSKQNAGVA